MTVDLNSVILVDENDSVLGISEKMEAHRKALLHRAFSVLIFNKQHQILLQRRALDKYHSPGLWTNTCCSHPFPNENTLDAAHRRLSEEMGFDCSINEIFSFIYKAPFDNGLTEHEFDHVFVGFFDGEPNINTEEVEAWKWMDWNTLLADIEHNKEEYTVWFQILCKQIVQQGISI
jgi:isopentenyl-diphosphate delta-isomerase